MKIIVTLSVILKERNMTQKELSQLTGIREATISSITRNAGDKINSQHLAKILSVLGITDFNKIFKIEK